MTMTVSVDQGRCASSGNCAMRVPEVFDQDDEGIVLLLQDSVGEDLQERVREAAFNCPVSAIVVS